MQHFLKMKKFIFFEIIILCLVVSSCTPLGQAGQYTTGAINPPGNNLATDLSRVALNPSTINFLATDQQKSLSVTVTDLFVNKNLYLCESPCEVITDWKPVSTFTGSSYGASNWLNGKQGLTATINLGRNQVNNGNNFLAYYSCQGIGLCHGGKWVKVPFTVTYEATGSINSCVNSVKDNQETDVDCGGSSCFACSEGKQCSLNTDCATGKCTNGVCALSSCTISNDIIAWWPGDGSGEDLDPIRPIIMGYMSASPSFAQGIDGLGFSLTSATQYSLMVTPYVSYDIGKFSLSLNDGFTIDLWMKGTKTQPGPNFALVTTSYYGSSNTLDIGGDKLTGKLGLSFGSAAITSDQDILDNSFHHITVTADGTAIKLYIDGTLKGSVSTTGIGAPSLQSFRLGSFAGIIDEVKIYKRVLSQTEIQNPSVDCKPRAGSAIVKIGSNGVIADVFKIGQGMNMVSRAQTIDANGNIWIAISSIATTTGVIQKFDSAGTKLASFNVPFSPGNIKIDNEGNLWIAGLYNAFLYKYNQQGQQLNTLNVATSSNSYIYDLAVGAGNVWVIGASLLRFNYDLQPQPVTLPNIQRYNFQPLVYTNDMSTILSLDPSGNLYVGVANVYMGSILSSSTLIPNAVLKIDVNGNLISTTTHKFNSQEISAAGLKNSKMIVDSSGNLWTIGGNTIITKTDSNGISLGAVKVGTGIKGILPDSSGNIYALVDSTKYGQVALAKMNFDGNIVKTFALGDTIMTAYDPQMSLASEVPGPLAIDRQRDSIVFIGDAQITWMINSTTNNIIGSVSGAPTAFSNIYTAPKQHIWEAGNPYSKFVTTTPNVVPIKNDEVYTDAAGNLFAISAPNGGNQGVITTIKTTGETASQFPISNVQFVYDLAVDKNNGYIWAIGYGSGFSIYKLDAYNTLLATFAPSGNYNRIRLDNNGNLVLSYIVSGVFKIGISKFNSAGTKTDIIVGPAFSQYGPTGFVIDSTNSVWMPGLDSLYKLSSTGIVTRQLRQKNLGKVSSASMYGADQGIGKDTNGYIWVPYTIIKNIESPKTKITITTPISDGISLTLPSIIKFSAFNAEGKNIKVYIDDLLKTTVPSTVTSYALPTDLSNGQHIIRVELVDASGNSLQLPLSDLRTFTKIPVLTITSPIESGPELTITRPDLIFTFTAISNMKLNVSVDGVTQQGYLQPTQSPYTYTVPNPLNTGSHTVVFEIVNNDGTSLSPRVSASRTFNINCNPWFLLKWISPAWHIAVDSANNVYGAEMTSNRIQKFSSTGDSLLSIGSFGAGNGQMSYPYGVALDSAGNIYVADYGNRRVDKFNSAGTFSATWGSSVIGSNREIAVDSLSNVYYTTDDSHITKTDSNGNTIFGWPKGGVGTGNGQFDGLYGIAVDASNNVYTVESRNHRVQKFDSNGNYIKQWGTQGNAERQFNAPQGIAVDSAGNVYVADTLNARIQKFTSEGVFISKFGSRGSADGQFSFPRGIAVDSAGNIYVADNSAGRIQKFSPGCAAS